MADNDKKITWSRIKEYVYIGTIVIGALLFWRDEVKEDALTEATLIQLQKDVSKIKSTQDTKFYQYDQYWIINTANITAITTTLGIVAK